MAFDVAREMQRYERGELPDGTVDADGNPKPEPLTLEKIRAARKGKVRNLNFLALTYELDSDTSMDAQTDLIGSYAFIGDTLQVENIGSEMKHRKSYYRALSDLIDQRNMLGRLTVLSFSRPDVKKDIKTQLGYQNALDIWERLVEVSRTAYDRFNEA